MLKFLLIFLLVSCGAKKDDKKLSADPDLAKKRSELLVRFENYLDEGWVIGKVNGKKDKLGDSLIWTGLALAGLECDRAKWVLEKLTEESQARGGGLPRHYSFPKVTNTIDGYVGLHYGLVRYAKKCKDLKNASKLYDLTRDSYRELLTESLYYVIDRGDAYFRKDVAAISTTNGEALFDTAITGWAVGIVSAKQACYKLHLASLMAAFVEETGAGVNSKAFCEASKKADLPFTDAYCGRRNAAKEFLINFKYDQWENRNQRCPAWESEDNANNKFGGIDFLETYDYTF